MDKRKEMAELRNALRLFVKANSASMSDEDALSVSGLHATWMGGMTYSAGQVFQYNGALYRVVQGVTAMLHQPPDGEGLLAIYRPIVMGHEGTREDPIPYVYGMDVCTGLYYTYNGSLWQAVKDMRPCVWPPAEGTEWALA